MRLASFLTAVSALVATATSSAAVAPQLQSAQRIAWSSCYEPAKELECARIAVPLNWQRPHDGKIKLAVIRHRASRSRERIGSLFFNWGGPGVAGVPKVRDMVRELDAMGEGRFDVVSWDPRGTGDSDHIACFRNEESRKRFWGRNWSIPTTSAESVKYLRKATEFVRRCTALSGKLLAHISTADTVRDLDYLRQLLGDTRLNYRGISYGTFIGQTYANMFPTHVRAMVLDGVVDPVAFTDGTAQNISKSIADADLVLDKFQSLCKTAGPARCDLARGGSIAPRLRQLFARLQRAPIGNLTYGNALIVLWAKLGAPTQWPQLATELNEAANGNGAALKKAAQSVKTFAEPALDSAVGLQCADKPFPPRPRLHEWRKIVNQLTHESVISGPVNGWLLWAPCAAWPVRSADRYAGPWNAFTNNRILVIGTRFDPNTAYANAVRAASRLRNAVLLTHDGYGHTSDADPSTCVERAVTAYLVHLITPPKGKRCASNRRPFEE